MQETQLKEVLNWAYSRIVEDEHTLQGFYDFMKLIDALEGVIPVIKEENANKSFPSLQIVDDNYYARIASNENNFLN